MNALKLLKPEDKDHMQYMYATYSMYYSRRRNIGSFHETGLNWDSYAIAI